MPIGEIVPTITNTAIIAPQVFYGLILVLTTTKKTTMKMIKIGLVALSLSAAFFAFTTPGNTTKISSPQTLWQDTIPYHRYDPGRIYVDPNSGDSIEIWMEPSSHRLVNKRNNTPVTIYVDPMTTDTLYGEGYVVNNMVTRMPNGKYMVDSTKVKIEGNKIKYKDGSSKGKVKIEDNKIKAKDGHDKTKLKDVGDSIKVKKG
jgi:hypothetical protein